MRRTLHLSDGALADAYAEWLERRVEHGELVERVERAFREKGPPMALRMRLDLNEFLRERSGRELARCVAINDDPRDDGEFIAWLDGRRT